MLRGLFKKVGSIIAGRKLDEALLEELEEQLVMGDVSLDTTQHLIDNLRAAAARGEAPTDEAAIEVLKQQVTEILAAQSTQLEYSDGITVWLFVGVNGVGKNTTIGKVAHWLKAQ